MKLKPETEIKGRQMSVNMTTGEFEAVAEAARKSGVSKSDILRNGIAAEARRLLEAAGEETTPLTALVEFRLDPLSGRFTGVGIQPSTSNAGSVSAGTSR